MITPPLSISARPLLTRIVPYSAIELSVARSDLIEERAMEPWSREPVGRFDELEIESDVLRDNPLGDPHVRPLWVYVPPAYDAEPDRRFPSIYLIQGMTGQLDMWRNRTAFRPSTPENIDRLFAEEDCPPALVVAVDAWTSYGGSQFIDSPGTGRYGEYLCDEVVSFVDSRYRTLAEAAHRGITGKSSGGYGAMVVPMLRPDVFGGLATHSGDALFELCYLPEFREAARALRDEYDGSVRALLGGLPLAARVHEAVRLPARQRVRDGGVLLGERGRLDRPPVRHGDRDAARGRLAALARVGSGADGAPPRRRAARPARDLHRRRQARRVFLDLGAEAFRRELEELGITDVFFELFDAKHGGIEYRYPLAIRYLAERLQ